MGDQIFSDYFQYRCCLHGVGVTNMFDKGVDLIRQFVKDCDVFQQKRDKMHAMHATLTTG
eukprot:12411890-Karenia_brevis.AAC.1